MPTKTLNRHRTKHGYSSLEQRRMLAGDIRVVENVHLFIRGDAADNQFEVVVEDDQLQINGLDGTTIRKAMLLKVLLSQIQASLSKAV